MIVKGAGVEPHSDLAGAWGPRVLDVDWEQVFQSTRTFETESFHFVPPAGRVDPTLAESERPSKLDLDFHKAPHRRSLLRPQISDDLKKPPGLSLSMRVTMTSLWP